MGDPRERLRASAVAVREVFVQPAMRRAVIAFATTSTANWAVTVAVGVLAYEDGGAGAVGLVALARMLPSAFVVPVLTAVADRVPRERILIAAATIQGAATGVAALLLAADGASVPMYALVVVATVAHVVVRPCHSALVPSLCRTTAELASATVATAFLGALAALLGPLVTGALITTAGPEAVFGAGFGLCALATFELLRIEYEALARPAGPRPHIGREVVDGIAIVARHRELRLVYLGVLGQTYVRGSLNVLLVVIAFDRLGTDDAGVAALAAAFGVGGLVGSFASSLLAGTAHLGRWLVGALALWGAPIALIATVSSPAAAWALVALVGFANAVIDVPFFTLPVRLVDDAVLGRVFGVFEALVSLGVAAGSIATPALISGAGLDSALVITGLLLPLLGLLVWVPMTRMDQRLGVRDREIRALRAAPMFAVLPVASIEQLATTVGPVTVRAGDVIVAQGDEADAAFVIVEGRADVRGGGSLLGTAGPGDTIGEIALLHDTTRTATVRALDDVELLRIDRAAFLEAVTGHRHSREAAFALADARLGHFRPAGT